MTLTAKKVYSEVENKTDDKKEIQKNRMINGKDKPHRINNRML
jgi:hypothetical protein